VACCGHDPKLPALDSYYRRGNKHHSVAYLALALPLVAYRSNHLATAIAQSVVESEPIVRNSYVYNGNIKPHVAPARFLTRLNTAIGSQPACHLHA